MRIPFNRLDYGLSDAEIIDACRISRRTLQNWKRHGIPEREHDRLLIVSGRRLPWARWRGWTINRAGELCDYQTDTRYSPEELRATFYRLAMMPQDAGEPGRGRWYRVLHDGDVSQNRPITGSNIIDLNAIRCSRNNAGTRIDDAT